MLIGNAAHSTLCTVSQGFVDNVATCANSGANVIMARVPISPYPYNVPYTYKAIVDPDNNNRPSKYEILFRLETNFAGLAANTDYIATPSGVRKK